MNNAYLLIGGNEGDRLVHLKEATERIAKYCGQIIRSSSLYETAAWGKTNQASFLNQVIVIKCNLTAPQLMDMLLEIEGEMGRKRAEKYGPRKIDIDILFFGNEIWDLPQLKIPHPEIANRRFTLEPMNEIAPTFLHPVLQRTMSQLLAESTDMLDVKKFSTN